MQGVIVTRETKGQSAKEILDDAKRLLIEANGVDGVRYFTNKEEARKYALGLANASNKEIVIINKFK